MANLLVALGLQVGDRVAAQVDKSPEALVLYLASLRAGMDLLMRQNCHSDTPRGREYQRSHSIVAVTGATAPVTDTVTGKGFVCGATG